MSKNHNIIAVIEIWFLAGEIIRVLSCKKMRKYLFILAVENNGAVLQYDLFFRNLMKFHFIF